MGLNQIDNRSVFAAHISNNNHNFDKNNNENPYALREGNHQAGITDNKIIEPFKYYLNH